MRDLRFPLPGGTPLERLVVRCWLREFAKLPDSAQETACLDGAKPAKHGTSFGKDYLAGTQARLYQSRLVAK